MKNLRKIIIAAVGPNGVIGRYGKTPWTIPEELAHFKRSTIGFPVIMGRRTFESLGRPLGQRTNIILSKYQNADYENVHFVKSFENAMETAGKESGKVFIIGGGEIFENTIHAADELILSFVEGDFEGDTFFPVKYIDDFTLTGVEEHNKFIVKFYSRIND